jgi:beta-lactamase regulating signal transducer with metallopeptidase domain
MKHVHVSTVARISVSAALSLSRMQSNFAKQLNSARLIAFSLRPTAPSLRPFHTADDQTNQPTSALWVLQLLIFVAMMLQILQFAPRRTLLQRFPAYIHR